ncbi:MAG: Gfo/Idh/MocA family oxidoreductase, partial [Gemmatimonadota bacterium]
DFLVRSAALAAAGSLLAASEAYALEQPLPFVPERVLPRANEPVRLGVIGTGGMGTEHCSALMRLQKGGKADLQLIALADVCQPRLNEAEQKVIAGGATWPIRKYTNYRELLDDPAIHGVLIAAPEHWHAKMVEAAVAAGKGVYVEKPMTLRLNDALRLRRLVESNPTALVIVGTQRVMSSVYQEAAKWIAAGAIGKATSSQTSYCRNSKDGEWLYYKIDPAWQPGVNLDWREWCGPLGKADWNPEVYARWRRYRKYSTGIIGDLLVHQLAPMMQVVNAGWPTRVIASGGHYVDQAMENHDQVNLNIEFEGGHTMIVAGSTCNEVGLETLVRGHKANLYVAGNKLTLRPERIYAEEVQEKTYDAPNLGEVQDLLRLNWIECIRGNQKPMSDVELGTKVMIVADLATRSIWEGKAFGYDPKKHKAFKI